MTPAMRAGGEPPCPDCGADEPMAATSDPECYSCGFPLVPDAAGLRYLNAHELALEGRERITRRAPHRDSR